MLDARSYAGGLHSRYERLAEYAGKIRVFRVILEVAPAERIAFDVKRGREQKIHAERRSFAAYCRAHIV